MITRPVVKGDTFWHYGVLEEVAYVGWCGTTIVDQDTGVAWEFCDSGRYLGSPEDASEARVLVVNANAQGLRFLWQPTSET